jgi:hypothetical protein
VTPDALNTEALALAWATHVGAVTWDEVVTWADGWILRLDAPPQEVLELSLSESRPEDGVQGLSLLALPGDEAAAGRLLAQRLLDELHASGKGVDSLGELFCAVYELGWRTRFAPNGLALPAPPSGVTEAAQVIWVMTMTEPRYRDATDAEVLTEMDDMLRELL